MLTVGTIHGPSCERTVSRVRFRDELGLAISNTASMKHKVRNMHTHLVRTVLCKNAPQRTNGGWTHQSCMVLRTIMKYDVMRLSVCEGKR